MMIDESSLRVRFDALRPSLDERRRRLSAAAEAKAAGYGGIAAVARATKVARSTIGRAGDDGRPDAAVAMGLQEPRQAGDGASRHGSQSEFLDHSQAAGGTEILSPFQPQDQGSRQTS